MLRLFGLAMILGFLSLTWAAQPVSSAKKAPVKKTLPSLEIVRQDDRGQARAGEEGGCVAHPPVGADPGALPADPGSARCQGLSAAGGSDRSLGPGLRRGAQEIPGGAEYRLHRKDQFAVADRAGARAQTRNGDGKTARSPARPVTACSSVTVEQCPLGRVRPQPLH